MRGKNYFLVLVLTIINFICATILFTYLPQVQFIKELAWLMLFMVIGAITLVSIGKRFPYAYLMGLGFFSANLLNTLYIYMNIPHKSVLFIAMFGANIAGILVTQKNIRGVYKKKRLTLIKKEVDELKVKSRIIEKELKSLENDIPKVIIEDYGLKKKNKAKPSKREVRFVGNISTKKFHDSKCGFAKKTKKEKKIVFKTKSEAKRKGFKAHNCVG